MQYRGGGSPARCQFYEYRFQPLSFRQNSALALAYGSIALYVTLSLRRLKAFHSRFGLVVTALTQMTTSILASFTICGLLKINLAQIPQEAYPFVVLIIGLENIFRLINAVLAYPPEMMNTQRIANGIGDIGHASVASAAQNLLILWLLSLVVSPGVAAFCAFAAVALLFDYFFLMTFFVAVLNVDIRRLELQDSISRGPHGPKRKVSPERHTWIDALLQGHVPFSTRMAGSAVTISFVMALNWHFNDHAPALPFRVFPGLFEKQKLPLTEFDGISLPSINQTRHFTSSPRTQDYENAVHFMNLVKPGASGFVAKIYDPLVVVLGGADRSGVPIERRTWLSALRSVAIQHFYPTALAVVFVVAFVTILMNFLLWDNRAEEAELDNLIAENSMILSANPITTTHTLDIIKLAGCKQGHVVSASLDRTISILVYDFMTCTYHSVPIPPEDMARIRWPVHACAIDGQGDWFALLCSHNEVLVGNVHEGRLVRSFLVQEDDDTPLVFDFVPQSPMASQQGACIALIMPSGKLIEYSIAADASQHFDLCSTELVAATLGLTENNILQIVLQSLDDRLISCRKVSGSWRVHQTITSPSKMAPSRVCSSSVDLATSSELDMCIICTAGSLIWQRSSAMAQAPAGLLLTPNSRPSSTRVIHSGRGQCSTCASATVKSVSFVYSDNEKKDCVMQTLSARPHQTNALNLFDADVNCDCLGNAQVRKMEHRLAECGSWETTSEAVVGLRRRAEETLAPATISSPAIADGRNNILSRRRHIAASQAALDEVEQWEAYLLSADGELRTIPVDLSAEGQLYSTRAGPACCVSPRSVAVAIGNTIVIIKTGRDRNESGLNGMSDGASQVLSSRRRNTARKML
ncbi:hypothetical protein BT93_L4372 [Corymbia citriodora subsp. variegata]|uniref:SSD domain-containing protein n=1 Tax=Corymbia citriodora subsp. variegata TaxID=360336 RepID=A0A8T0CI33_CORYI|nr:hypothetical protein BT93_L4372 [Corymbia citriodora subsp. variegata]